jgi:hypothetical protein
MNGLLLLLTDTFMAAEMPSLGRELRKAEQEERENLIRHQQYLDTGESQKPLWAKQEIINSIRTPEKAADLLFAKCVDTIAYAKWRLESIGYWSERDLPESSRSSTNRMAGPEVAIVDIHNIVSNRILMNLSEADHKEAVRLLLQRLHYDINTPVDLDKDRDIADALQFESFYSRNGRFGTVTAAGVDVILSQHVYRTVVPGLFVIIESYNHTYLNSAGEAIVDRLERENLSILLKIRPSSEHQGEGPAGNAEAVLLE